MNKNKKTEKTLRQTKFKEISMGSDLIDEIFDSSKKMGFETEDERVYREQKEDYNRTVVEQIRKVVSGSSFGNLNFTDRQKEVFEYMFQKGLSATETGNRLGIKCESVNTIKKLIVKKVQKKIKYEFTFKENP